MDKSGLSTARIFMSPLNWMKPTIIAYRILFVRLMTATASSVSVATRELKDLTP